MPSEEIIMLQVNSKILTDHGCVWEKNENRKQKYFFTYSCWVCQFSTDKQ